MYVILSPQCPCCVGVPTPVAQSRIQECLAQLSEADYNSIMREYKVHRHSMCVYLFTGNQELLWAMGRVWLTVR